jgi:hypothetical protein
MEICCLFNRHKRSAYTEERKSGFSFVWVTSLVQNHIGNIRRSFWNMDLLGYYDNTTTSYFSILIDKVSL